MDVVFNRVAGLDIGKASVTVCVRTPGQGGKREVRTRMFRTMTRSLALMADWLGEAALGGPPRAIGPDDRAAHLPRAGGGVAEGPHAGAGMANLCSHKMRAPSTRWMTSVASSRMFPPTWDAVEFTRLGNVDVTFWTVSSRDGIDCHPQRAHPEAARIPRPAVTDLPATSAGVFRICRPPRGRFPLGGRPRPHLAAERAMASTLSGNQATGPRARGSPGRPPTRLHAGRIRQCPRTGAARVHARDRSPCRAAPKAVVRAGGELALR